MSVSSMIWKEKTPVRGMIRRSLRSVNGWARENGLPSLVVVCVMAGLSLQFFTTLGRSVSGPVAHPSASSSTLRFSSLSTTGPDPVTVASRADQGHLSGVAR